MAHEAKPNTISCGRSDSIRAVGLKDWREGSERAGGHTGEMAEGARATLEEAVEQCPEAEEAVFCDRLERD